MVKLQHTFDWGFWVFGWAVGVSVKERHFSVEIGLGPLSILLWIGR